MGFEGMDQNLNISDAFSQIESIKGQLATWGGNDSEMKKLNEIQHLLREGKINPQEAITEAQKILEGKQRL